MSDMFTQDDLISAYSRAEALADGVLIDVTKTAREAGFSVPVAITANVHALLEPDDADKTIGQSYEGRLWDVIWMAYLAARRNKNTRSDTAYFRVIIAHKSPDDGQDVMQEYHDLKLVAGPDDDLNLVLTIMEQQED